jgi:hypothetical protein
MEAPIATSKTKLIDPLIILQTLLIVLTPLLLSIIVFRWEKMDFSFSYPHSLIIFSKHFFTTEIFLISAFIAAWFLGLRPPSYIKSIAGIIALSFAVATLLTADSITSKSVELKEIPKSFPAVFYILFTQRQALLILIIFSFVLFSIGIYHLFRSLFTVTYSGSGIQIKLPGQLMYYFPIYPQLPWQNTKIMVKEGEKLSIELSGYVSPGALQDITLMKDHLDLMHKWQKNGDGQKIWKKHIKEAVWPYTGPEGYKEEYYGTEKKLEILKKHPFYKEDYYYKKDRCLTVQGLPHNKVLGYIQAGGDPPPLEARIGSPAYNYENLEDKEKLINLSSESYPITIETKKTGVVWIVINDVDYARWDNAGMFFLKLIKHSWT